MSTYLRTDSNPLGFGYARGSTLKQLLTTEMQDSLIQETVPRYNIPFATTFKDSAISGRMPFRLREEAKRLIDVIRPGDHIFVWKLDRIGRSLRDIIWTLEFMVKREVNIHILEYGAMQLDLSTAFGRLFIHFMAGFAEFEADLIAERTRAALQWRKNNGMRYHGNLVRGKKRMRPVTPVPGSRAKYILIDCPEEMELIRMAYRFNRDLKISERQLERFFASQGKTTAEGQPITKWIIHRWLHWYKAELAAGRVA